MIVVVVFFFFSFCGLAWCRIFQHEMHPNFLRTTRNVPYRERNHTDSEEDDEDDDDDNDLIDDFIDNSDD